MDTKEEDDCSPTMAATKIISACPEGSPHATLQPTFKMVMIGETGSGKTSFLELLLNYSKQFGKDYQLDLVTDFIQQGQSKSESMLSTSTKTEKRTAIFDDFLLDIIDTPGFCDTRGNEQDTVNLANIIATVKKELYVNAVCLVINGTESRRTAHMIEVIKQIESILPPSILRNIIVVFTKVSDELSLEFDIGLLKKFQLAIPKEHVFTIDNPYSRRKRLQANPPKKLLEKLSLGFSSTHEVLNEMFKLIKSLKPAVTLEFGEFQEAVQGIKDNHVKIQTHLHNKDTVLKMIKDGSFEEPMEKVRYSKMVARRSVNQSLICTFPGCYHNCHPDCNSIFAFIIPDYCNYCFTKGKKCFSSCLKCSHLSRYHHLSRYVYEEQDFEIIYPGEVPAATKKNA